MTALADRYTAHHRAMLAELGLFVERRGWPALGRKTIVRGRPLGRWVNGRRRDYLAGRLAKWLERALQAIPGWTFTPRLERNYRALVLLRRYVSRHGWDGLIHRDVVRDGINLSRFVNSRRHRRRKGRFIPGWVVRELESIPGFSWEPLDDQMRQSLSLLRAVVATHRAKTASVPGELVNLARWIRKLRRRDRGGRPIAPALRRALEGLPGWTWRGRAE